MVSRRRRSSGSKERKYAEVTYGDTAAATGSQWLGSLSALVTQGTAENQRIGRKYTIRSISLRGEVKMPNNATTLGVSYPQADVARIIVVNDKQPNGTTANFAEIFSVGAASSAGGPGTIDMRAFRNMDNISRFDILLDRMIYVQNSAYTGGSGSAQTAIKPFSLYRKCFIPVEMKDVTGSVANVTTNNVAVYIIGSAGYCTVNAIARIRFSDES